MSQRCKLCRVRKREGLTLMETDETVLERERCGEVIAGDALLGSRFAAMRLTTKSGSVGGQFAATALVAFVTTT